MEAESVYDKFFEATEDVTLNVRQTLVYGDSTAGAFTITLPPVGEAKGLLFSIVMTVDNGDITIADQDDSIGWDGDYTLNDVNDGFLLYSDGVMWWNVSAKT
jgi:hypothetical protein